MKVPHILVVGSVNVDMVVKSQRLPAPAETVTGGEFIMAQGGKGANQAVAAVRLGAEVTLVATVGADGFGDQAMETFRREGIHIQAISRDAQHATGIALILVDAAGQNLISVASGANHCWSPAAVQQVEKLIPQADMVLLQLEIPMKVIRVVAAAAVAANVPVILNPAPALPLTSMKASSQQSLLRQVTYLTPNESEAQQLTGVSVTDEASARVAAQRLLAMGVGHVVMTMGARGAMLADAEKTISISAPAVKAVDTTAAGDAFNGALAIALAHKKAVLTQAVREACIVGALSTMGVGAQPALPTQAAVRAFKRARKL